MESNKPTVESAAVAPMNAIAANTTITASFLVDMFGMIKT